MEFQKNLQALQNAIEQVIKHKVDVTKISDPAKSIYNYQEKQKSYVLNSFKSSLKLVKSSAAELQKLAVGDEHNKEIVDEIFELMGKLQTTELEQLSMTVMRIQELSGELRLPLQESQQTFSMPKSIPSDIQPEIKADIQELNKCFSNDCLRSSIILCGRILETALHRKYYEITKNDLLEKSPGIGLGNLLAKLKEHNVVLDPGLMNQIHLINQVRIFSVHTKKEVFYPSKQQTYATILYTMDILERLFH